MAHNAFARVIHTYLKLKAVRQAIVHSALLIANPFPSSCNKGDGKKAHPNYKAFTINKTIHLRGEKAVICNSTGNVGKSELSNVKCTSLLRTK